MRLSDLEKATFCLLPLPLKGLGNGNIGGDLLRKTCNTCNLAAFLPDSLPQQRTTVSRCSHELQPMENLLTFLHLSSPCARCYQTHLLLVQVPAGQNCAVI